MAKRIKKKSKAYPQLILYSPSWRRDFPEDWTRCMKSSELLGLGFKRINETDYEKTYCDFLKLRLTTSQHVVSSYDWTLNEENFQKMIEDLTAIKRCLDEKSEELYESIRRQRRIGKGQKDRKTKIQRQVKLQESMDAVYRMKQDFLNNYRDFLTISLDIEIKSPYWRDQYFFFDACKTTKQLHLYFEFIELFKDIFGALVKSRRYIPKIAFADIRRSIAEYYVMLFTIRKIRKIFQRGLSPDELRAKFPMIREELLDNVTLDAQNRKGWAYKASNLALDFASRSCSTTPNNFKQTLKKENDFARKVKKHVSRVKEVEKMFAGKIPVSLPLRAILKAEEWPEDDRVAIIRYTLSAESGPLPGDVIPLQKR